MTVPFFFFLFPDQKIDEGDTLSSCCLVSCPMSSESYTYLFYVSICKKKKEEKKEKLKERGKKISVSNNEHVHLFASGLHTQFSQEARVDHDLAFDISCLQARGD